MRYCIVFALLMLSATAVSAFTKEELDAFAAAALQRAADAKGIDLTGGAGSTSGCIGSAPGGISLLGVQSDMGPSTQGVAKLARDHPAMKALIEVGTEMGLYADAEGASDADKARNAALRQRKALHDTYAQFVGYGESGTSLGGTPMADLFGWVHEGRMEAMAEAYKVHHPLALQYAAFYELAEIAGRACP